MKSETPSPHTALDSDPLERDKPTGTILTGLFAGFLLLFALGLSATMIGPEKYHGDEAYYTDAAIRMCESGDYWTPTYIDGHIRLEKPILAYWAIAGSFRVFGVSMFASRLPAVAAGVCLLLVTFCLARTLFGAARTGFLAALIAASNLELMRLATRATPDMFVCLFVAVSMLGFARIWFRDDRSFWGPFLAFGGLGLAVQTKGLLGLTPVLANVLFFVLIRPKGSSVRALWAPLALVIGLLLAGFWYAVMIQRHGLHSLSAFSEDQVGAHLSTNPLYLLVSPAFYLATVLQYFHIWGLILLLGVIHARGAAKEFWGRHRGECVFLLSLLAVLVVSFSFGDARRARYLAAAYPLVACALAGAIHSLACGGTLQRWSARLGLGLGAVLAALGLLLSVAGLWLDVRLVIGGLLWLATGVVGILAVRSASGLWRWSWIAGVFVVGFIAHGACFRPLLSPSPLRKLTREVLLRPASDTLYFFKMGSRDPGIIRLLSGGKLKTKVLDTLTPTGASPSPSPVASRDPEPLRKAGYSLQQIKPDTALPESIVGPRRPDSICWLGTRD